MAEGTQKVNGNSRYSKMAAAFGI